METQTQKIPDETLVQQAQAGDKQAMEILFFRYGGVIRSKARGFFLAGGETEDLVQEGMMGLYEAVSDYKKSEKSLSFKNFAYLCISRKIIDAVKASARKKNIPLNNYVSLFSIDWELPERDPEEELLLSESRREFMQKISGVLSDFEFKVLIMYVDGMTTTEICQGTGKDGKSVDNALQRSKKKLQKLFKTQR